MVQLPFVALLRQRQRRAPLHHDVTAGWLWKYLRKWEPHWTSAEHCTCLPARWSSGVSFHSLTSPSLNSVGTDADFLLRLRLGGKNKAKPNCWAEKFQRCYSFSRQKTSSLSQLPVEELKDPLPPPWRCYMSPQGRRYYVNTTNNGKSIDLNSWADITSHVYVKVYHELFAVLYNVLCPAKEERQQFCLECSHLHIWKVKD